MIRRGGCLCGRVRYEARGEPRETLHCHCRMCQLASGSAFLTWTTYPAESLSYVSVPPASYRSSPDAVREFCPACGTALVFRADRETSVDITTASFDDPDAFAPVANIWTSSRRGWLHDFDSALPDLATDWEEDADKT